MWFGESLWGLHDCWLWERETERVSDSVCMCVRLWYSEVIQIMCLDLAANFGVFALTYNTLMDQPLNYRL